MFNLILALVWLVCAVVAFVRPIISPELPAWVIPGTDIPLGWFFVLMAVYNVVRWWFTRPRAREHVPLRTLPRPEHYDDE
jgi:hypothetical protein